MTFSQIQQLLAIEKFGTLSAAAAELNTSQSALSRSMQSLEKELGLELFRRTKNRAELNDAGRLAVEYARPIVSAADNFTARMKDYKRSRTTVCVGSCAPGPMWLIASELIPRLQEKTVAYELRSAEEVEEGLLSGAYHLAILNRPAKKETFLCRKYVTERLFVSLPPAHPLAVKEGIRLSELAGQTMLLYADLGVWERLRREKMEGVHFIVQKERDAFADLITASALPNFTTNLTRRLSPPPMERREIPVLDEEASIDFYLCVTEQNRRLLESVPVHAIS